MNSKFIMLHRPQTGDAIILIGEGQYFETVNVSRAAPLILLVNAESLHKHELRKLTFKN